MARHVPRQRRQRVAHYAGHGDPGRFGGAGAAAPGQRDRRRRRDLGALARVGCGVHRRVGRYRRRHGHLPAGSDPRAADGAASQRKRGVSRRVAGAAGGAAAGALARGVPRAAAQRAGRVPVRGHQLCGVRGVATGGAQTQRRQRAADRRRHYLLRFRGLHAGPTRGLPARHVSAAHAGGRRARRRLLATAAPDGARGGRAHAVPRVGAQYPQGVAHGGHLVLRVRAGARSTHPILCRAADALADRVAGVGARLLSEWRRGSGPVDIPIRARSQRPPSPVKHPTVGWPDTRNAEHRNAPASRSLFSPAQFERIHNQTVRQPDLERLQETQRRTALLSRVVPVGHPLGPHQHDGGGERVPVGHRADNGGGRCGREEAKQQAAAAQQHEDVRLARPAGE
eukprot:ctg_2894.g404